MSKNKFLTIITIVLIIVIVFLYLNYTTNILQKGISYLFPPKLQVDGIVLFYRGGCSHCENVEKFILENNIEGKVDFTRLEVSKNNSNANLLLEKANLCGFPTDKIGVPFLWDGSKCIIGEFDIIDFFKNAK